MNDDTRIDGKRAAVRITTAAIVSSLVYAFVMTLPSALINEIIDAFSLKGAGEGLMISLINIGFLATLIVIPLFQGRIHKITMIIAANVLMAVTLVMIGAASGLVIFAVACVILGVSSSFIDTSSNSVIVDVYKADSAKYLGYLHGVFGVGSLIAPLLIFRVMRYLDWRGIHYAVAAMSVATAVFIFFLVRNRSGSAAAPVIIEQKLRMSDIAEYFRRRRNILLSLAGILASMAQSGVIMWIVRYMTLRFDAAELGALSMSVFWLCVTANRLLLAQVIKRAPMKFFALGALLFGVCLTIGVVSGNAVVLCIAMGATGFCGGLFIPVLVSEFAVGYEGRTSFTTSVVMFVTGIPRVAAPVLVALVSTKISLFSGMMIPVASAVLAAVCGLAIYKNEKAGVKS